MAKWQPPIPAGALYSKAARTLGPALPLLAYCYDLVQRDGWLDLNLKDAAGDMDEHYPTVKRWWQLITDGPFLAEVQNHGRKGLRVRFKDVWIDWRILNARTSSNPFDNQIGTETGSEMIPNVDEVPNRDRNGIIIGTETGSEMIPNHSGNKVLMTTDQAEIAEPRKTRPASAIRKSKSPDRTPEQQAYLDRKKAIEDAYVAELGYTPSAFGKEAKSSKWLSEQGYTPAQVAGCYRYLQKDEFYARQHISLATISKQIGAWIKLKSSRNGHAGGISPPPRPIIPPDVDRPQDAARKMLDLMPARFRDDDATP